MSVRTRVARPPAGDAAVPRVPGWAAAHAHRVALGAVLALAAFLNLGSLDRNGWGNTYYAAAARSMSGSWRDFWFASFDPGGLVSVDKTPLALWVQAASVRAFGYSEAAVLLPQALAGVASVGVLYLLVARPWGRVAGLLAAHCLAITPVFVAVGRDNNPDAVFLLLLLVASLLGARAAEGGRRGLLAAAGAVVGLAFLTKMLLALVVVPCLAAAYLAFAPLPRARRMRDALAAGAAAVAVGGAWVASVALTPSGSRPWVGSTSDDGILSLVLGYNGLGRVAGQTGGTSFAGGGGGAFSGEPGLLRLLNDALGDQIAWLLPLAVAGGVSLLLRARHDRDRGRRAHLLVVGGWAVTAAAVLSAAGGIVHTYYVALLAPPLAALTGAGAVSLAGDLRRGEAAPALPVAAFLATGVLQLTLRARTGWAGGLVPVILLGVAAAVALAVMAARRPAADPRAPLMARAAVGVALAALLAAPAAWSLSTHRGAVDGVFPGAGPRYVAGLATTAGAPPGGPGGMGGAPASSEARAAAGWAAANGGGTRWALVVVREQEAAPLVVDGLRVAAMGGFTGRETVIATGRIADLVASGALRHVLVSPVRTLGGGGNATVARVAAVCTPVPSYVWSGGAATSGTLYDCAGAAAALRA